MALIKIFNISAFNSRVLTTQAIFCLLFLYGWSSIPLVYCLVRLFKDTGTAFMATFCLWMFTGIITCVADLMLTLYAWAPGITRVQVILSRMFLIFPPYCLGSGLVHLMRNELMADFGRTIDANLYVNPFSMTLVGDRIIAMTVLGFVALCITYLLDLDLRLPNIFYKVCRLSLETFSAELTENLSFRFHQRTPISIKTCWKNGIESCTAARRTMISCKRRTWPSSFDERRVNRC